MSQLSRGSAPSPSLARRSDWQTCSSLDLPSGSSCRWASHFLVSSQLASLSYPVQPRLVFHSNIKIFSWRILKYTLRVLETLSSGPSHFPSPPSDVQWQTSQYPLLQLLIAKQCKSPARLIAFKAWIMDYSLKTRVLLKKYTQKTVVTALLQ